MLQVTVKYFTTMSLRVLEPKPEDVLKTKLKSSKHSPKGVISKVFSL